MLKSLPSKEAVASLPLNSLTLTYKSESPTDSLNLFQINIMLPSFVANVYKLPTRDCERHHYNSKEFSFFVFGTICPNFNYIFINIKSHRVRNNNRISLN